MFVQRGPPASICSVTHLKYGPIIYPGLLPSVLPLQVLHSGLRQVFTLCASVQVRSCGS